ncbi:MAG TPA: translation initiation factor IF-2 subunit alpha [Candidatus Thermoplasmatota archaeon]|nr:translation initiation factor IF-2 subunit alpha [Candidatus Thermoplasmatota archaeon]
MVKRNPFPEEGELVVATVKDVKGFGAFCNLDEYPGKEGFIHIAEVAAGWVKYVRDHVRENQKIVAKVLSVDPNRGHVDLSLKRVNDHQRRETIAAWKNESKAEKLLEILGERLGKKPEELLNEFGFKLMDAYGSLYAAFEAGSVDENSLEEEGFKGAWVKPFVELAKENIAAPFVHVKGYVELQSFASNGVADLREALEAAEESEYEDIEIEVQYTGAPRYRIKVKAPEYKAAEEELQAAAQRAIKIITKAGGVGNYVGRGEEA